MKKRISNKTVWITGASSGIGRAVAIMLAEQKNFVFVTGRNVEKLSELEFQFPNHVKAITGDVTNSQSMGLAGEKISTEIDHIDLVILCAGVCEYQDGTSFHVEMYRRVFDVNFFGAVNTVNAAMPLLERSQEQPLIVGISSLSAAVAFPRAEAYGSSKAALEYFLNSLKIDLSDSNVDVAIIRPGFVKTPLTDENDFDMPFIISAEESASYIIDAVVRRKPLSGYPPKLSVPIHLFAKFPRFWEKRIAPKFKKQEAI